MYIILFSFPLCVCQAGCLFSLFYAVGVLVLSPPISDKYWRRLFAWQRLSQKLHSHSLPGGFGLLVSGFGDNSGILGSWYISALKTQEKNLLTGLR